MYVQLFVLLLNIIISNVMVNRESEMKSPVVVEMRDNSTIISKVYTHTHTHTHTHTLHYLLIV